MTDSATVTNHGHPTFKETHAVTTVTTVKPQVDTTVTTTVTTDTANHGHDLPVYIQAVGPDACPKCRSTRVLEGPAYDRSAVRCQHCGHAWRADT